ncbi:MAG: sulfatase-like hydrolase/transferase [Proteobacteria bacterium]|nr:sulfatase-like hydrolase/transferase [Pseudomonadota bacterium]
MTLLTLMLACSGDEPTPETTREVTPEVEAPVAKADGPNLVIVTLDTTRWDHIGAYGYDKGRTETIDAFAAKGIRFDRAYSPLPLTIPAHASMFTGKTPPNHGIRNNGSAVLDAEHVTLAEVLSDAGYATAGSAAAYVTTDIWGLEQGFDVYFDDIESSLLSRSNIWRLERTADQTVGDIVGWLESEERDADQPFFTWVHVYDAHEPLQPPEGYQDLANPYDGEIAFVDDQIARLEEAIAAQGQADNTVWVLIGDHGEGHGDHVEETHGLFTYDNTQRVPFILTGPGIEPAVVSEPVGLIDLMPTVLAQLGVAAPEGMDGKVQPGNTAPVYIESYQGQERFSYAPHITVVDGKYKLIDTPRPELYDLLADPGETKDLAADNPDQVAAMQATLTALGYDAPSGGSDLDAETLQRLAALGYMAGGDDLRGVSDLPDPKDKLHILATMQEGAALAMESDFDGAIAKLEEVAAAEPKLVDVRQRLARLYSKKDDTATSLKWMDEAVAIDPSAKHIVLAATIQYTMAGQHEKALALAESGLELDASGQEFAQYKMINLSSMDRTPDAIAFAEGFLARNTKAYTISGMMGVLYASVPDMEKAEPLMRHSLQSPTPPRNVNYYMGVLGAGSKHVEEAIEHLRAELKLYPDNRQARVLLVTLLGNEDRHPEALPVVEVMLKARPGDIQLMNTKAQVLFNLDRYDEAGVVLAKVLEGDPEEPEALLLLANVQHKQGKEEEAKATFERAKASKAKRDPAPEEPKPEPSEPQ